MIVGVPGHVITERRSTVTPSNHLAEAQQFIQLGKKPRDFVFSYEVYLVPTCLLDLNYTVTYSAIDRKPPSRAPMHPTSIAYSTEKWRGPANTSDKLI